MISRLSGTLVSKHPPLLVLDVNGVGYEVEAPLSVFYDLPETGKPLVLLTHLSITDSAHTLYGFSSEAALTRLPGIGKKTAERIIIELRDKLGDLPEPAGGLPGGGPATNGSATAEAKNALSALGYKPQEVSRMVQSVAKPEMETEEIIRLALQSTVKK